MTASHVLWIGKCRFVTEFYSSGSDSLSSSLTCLRHGCFIKTEPLRVQETVVTRVASVNKTINVKNVC